MAKKAPTTPMKPTGNITERVRQLNRWRDYFNPLRGLSIRRARVLLESYSLGRFTELMWTYGAPALGIETMDADLSALITRRTAAIQKLDWEIKTKAEDTAGFDQALADKQAARLREVYEGIDNLPEAIAHFCLSTFRGFSLVEKWTNADGDIYHLEPVNHWNVVRDGSQGRWKYNPDARETMFEALPGEPLPEEQFLIRENPRPINVIALLKYVRGNLGEKNWDAFLEIYGIPGGVVTMPPNVPVEKEADYQSAAEKIAQGGSGALPNGSTFTNNDSPRGNQPFKERLGHLSEKLILAGTGGKLTMLASPTGIGSGPSEQHEDVFDDIAQAEAGEISMLCQKQIDEPILTAEFPGQPQLAYFAICAQEETDTSAFVDDVAKLATAGFQVDPAQIEEKTGYKVTLKPVASPTSAAADLADLEAEPKPEPAPALKNRAGGPGLVARTIAAMSGVEADTVQPVSERIHALMQRLAKGDITAAEFAAESEAIAATMPALFTTDLVREMAGPMEAGLGSAALNGVASRLEKGAVQ